MKAQRDRCYGGNCVKAKRQMLFRELCEGKETDAMEGTV